MRAHTGDKDKYLENLQTLSALLHIREYRCVKDCPFQTFMTFTDCVFLLLYNKYARVGQIIFSNNLGK